MAPPPETAPGCPASSCDRAQDARGDGHGRVRAARRAELGASGETARKRSVESLDQLTAREAQIARLARDGLSNPEIGARLFISPCTVEYQLHKVYGKLAITSRTSSPVTRAPR